jgi:hypothetical protein
MLLENLNPNVHIAEVEGIELIQIVDNTGFCFECPNCKTDEYLINYNENEELCNK